MTSEEAKFKVSLVYLVPILASLIFGLGCAWLLKPQQAQVIPVTPFPDDTASGPFGNAIYFVILVAISATVFYFLLKRKNVKIIKALIFLAMTTAAMLLSLVYLSALLAYTTFYSDLLVIGLSILITALFDLAIFKYTKARNVAVIGLGGALGVFFGFSIPLYSAIAILVFLAVYDVIAVYRGPVGKIAESGLDQLSGLSYGFKDIQMGLGDLVFYSMLMGAMFFSFPSSILPTIMSLVGICIGAVITFFMLEKKGIFPGLPFPIVLGLTFGLIASIII
ncbi:MAG: presenilin family intramembrane aspartyl protease [Candidatus Bathyarchaeia archaeon]|jgi:presenilin-like A22 family membrane protease